MRTGKAIKKQEIKKRGRGHPTHYDEKYNHIAEQACAIGATTEQLATILNVTHPTILHWKRDYYDFFSAVKNGKDKYDTEYVESSLLKRAKGYDKALPEERLTKDGGVVECTKTIHVMPDVGAAIFWLCNRQPQRWKQISQAKFQQMNLYSGNNGPGNGKGKNGKELQIDGTITPGDTREILKALHESGAFNDTGFSVPESPITEGSDSKVN